MKKNHYTIQVGKCGIQLGHEYWKQVCSDLFINPDGTLNLNKQKTENLDKNLFFDENSTGKLTPRTILFDLEPRIIGKIKNSTFFRFYPNENLIFDNQSAGNNWANGYIQANEHRKKLEEIIRKSIEKCNQMPTFSIFHSLVGGTGSGSGSYILELIKDEFLGKFITSYSIIPNQEQNSDTVVQPYNSILSIRWLTLYCDSVIFFENTSIEKIINYENKDKKTNFSEINSLISKILTIINFSTLSINICKEEFENIFIPLIPTPNLHFFIAGISNYYPRGKKNYFLLKNKNSIEKIFFDRSASVSFDHGKLISSFHFLNRDLSEIDIYQALEKYYKENKVNFIDWAPPSVHYTNSTNFLVKEKKKKVEVSLFNHTSAKNIFKKILTQYDLLRKRNAFINNYLKEFKFMNGLELFQDSRENILSVIEEYDKTESNVFP
nr:gamma-tubulin [Cryptomonas curvata]